MPILIDDALNLKTNHITNDLVIHNGQLQLSSGIDGVIQAAKQRLLLFKGEWFLDEDAGMPYFQEIFIKNVNIPNIRAKVKEILISVQGIDVQENIISITTDFVSAERKLNITWKALTVFGIAEGSI